MQVKNEVHVDADHFSLYWKIWIVGIIVAGILACGLYFLAQYYESHEEIELPDGSKPDQKISDNTELLIALALCGVAVVCIAIVVVAVCVCLPRMNSESMRLSFV